MPFPETPIIDTCVRSNTGPPPSADWISSVDSDHGGMKIVSNQMAPDAGVASAMWIPVLTAKQEIYFTLKAFPSPSGVGSFELHVNVQNGDTPTPSGYIMRFWHSGTGGAGQFELDRNDAGAMTRLVTSGGLTLALNDVCGIRNDNGVLRCHRNGIEIISAPDVAYFMAGKIGIGTLNDNSFLFRASDIGGGSFPDDRPNLMIFPKPKMRARVEA